MMKLHLSPRLRDALVMAVYALIIALLAAFYLYQAIRAGDGLPLMPVDDAYIHFQYARQAADGQPFVYNAGQEATSGATSLLYPFILALGYKAGFTGLALGYWAYLIGGLALFASALTVRAMSRAAGLVRWQYDLLGAAVAAWGTLVWHAFSGMETSLVVALTLLTLHAFERNYLRGFAFCAAVLAVLRPEASAMAIMAVVLYIARDWRSMGFRRAQLWLLLPVIAAGLQPILNLLVVGSASASGGQSKSLLGIVPFDLHYIVDRVVKNYMRAWQMFLTGISRDGIWVLPPLLGLFAVIGVFRIARNRPLVALLPLGWLILVLGAISTLDTAFWHFNRYTMPLMALAFPLAAYAVIGFPARFRTGLIGFILISGVLFNLIYIDLQRINVESVAAQPLKMARWLAENTPPDSLIAVHDVGLMRYLGERETLDMVGLTTAGAADAWRNGPGAVGEFVVNAPRRPDYFATYPDARGLTYLKNSIFGEMLAYFPHEFDPMTNVALAEDKQGIFRPDWRGVDAAALPLVDVVRAYLDDFVLVDMLNVAEVASEQSHGYIWDAPLPFTAYASEMYLLNTPGCAGNCEIVDGSRHVWPMASFTMAAQPNRDHIFVGRFLASGDSQFRLTVNDTYIIERTIPVDSQFPEIPVLIPAEVVTGDKIKIRIEPVGSLFINPARFWVYAGDYSPEIRDNPPLIFQDGAIGLAVGTVQDGDTLIVNLTWSTDGTAVGDYVAFVHVYDDLNLPPVAQSDVRPAGGALPPGAWLAGVFSDRIVLDLGQLEAGNYTLAVGLYAPFMFERLAPVSRGGDYVISEKRVLIREIEIAPDE